MVKAINKEKFLVFILIVSNGFNNFSIAVIRSVIVVVNVSIDAIAINRINLHIVKMPLFKSFLENIMYISNMKKKMKKNGLMLPNNAENFNLDSIINDIMKTE